MVNLLISGVAQGAFPELTPTADSATSVVIAATPVEASVTVPAGAVYAQFTGDTNFYATFDGTTVAVPGDTASSVATVSALNPSIKHIRNVATIKINAVGLAHVTVEFFS